MQRACLRIAGVVKPVSSHGKWDLRVGAGPLTRCGTLPKKMGLLLVLLSGMPSGVGLQETLPHL